MILVDAEVIITTGQSNPVAHIRVIWELIKIHAQGFPGDAVVKNPPANAGDTSSSPGQGRCHMPRSN